MNLIMKKVRLAGRRSSPCLPRSASTARTCPTPATPPMGRLFTALIAALSALLYLVFKRKIGLRRVAIVDRARRRTRGRVG